MGCCNVQTTYQPFPKKGRLALCVNKPLNWLASQLYSFESDVYCYVISTVACNNGLFNQRGCGPNWQGELITLCTCKHHMRAFRDLEGWKNTWIAGFSGIGAGGGKNALVYLMRVQAAYASHHDLWFSLPSQTRWAKATLKKTNQLGDVYRPLRRLMGSELFTKKHYYSPCDHHAHQKGWGKDISYARPNGRRAGLLVGDPKQSYLWDRPKVYIEKPVGRGQNRYRLQDLINQHLIEV